MPTLQPSPPSQRSPQRSFIVPRPEGMGVLGSASELVILE